MLIFLFVIFGFKSSFSAILPNASQIVKFSLTDTLSTQIKVNGVKYLDFNNLDVIQLQALSSNGTKLVSIELPQYQIDNKNQIRIPSNAAVYVNSPGLPFVYVLNQDLSLWKYNFDPNSKSFLLIDNSTDNFITKNYSNASLSVCKAFVNGSYSNNILDHSLIINSGDSLTFVNQSNISVRSKVNRTNSTFNFITKVSCENNTLFALTNSSTLELYKISPNSSSISFSKLWTQNDLSLKSMVDIAYDGGNMILFIVDKIDQSVQAFKFNPNATNLTSVPILSIKSTNPWQIFWDNSTFYIFELYTTSTNIFEYAIDTFSFQKVLNRVHTIYMVPDLIDVEPNIITMKKGNQISIFRRFVNSFLVNNSSLLVTNVNGDFGDLLQIVETGKYTAEIFAINKSASISLFTLNFSPTRAKITGNPSLEKLGSYLFPLQMWATNCIAINDTSFTPTMNITIPFPSPNPRSWNGCIKNYTINLEFYDERTERESKAWIAGLVIGLLVIFAFVALILWFCYREAKRKQKALNDKIDIYSSHTFMELNDKEGNVLSPQVANSNGKRIFENPKSQAQTTAKFQEPPHEIDENVINFEIE